MQRGNAEKAIDSFREVLDVDPNHLEGLSALSHLLRSRGQAAEALNLALYAARLSPDDASTQHNLGRCYLATGDLPLARTHLGRAAAIEPNLAAIHHDIAAVFQREGRIAEAVASLERAISLAPKDAEGYALLAHLFLNFGNFEGAISCLRLAYELEPNSARGLTRLGFALTEAGEMEEAERAVRAAVAMSPRLTDALVLLGRLLQNAGRFQEAQECLERATAMEPSKLGPYYRLVIGRKISGADNDLMDRMERILERRDITDAERALIEYSLGKSYDDLGNYEKAIGHFDAANRLEFERLKSYGRRYDPEVHRTDVNRTIRTYTPEYVARAAQLGSEREGPVFVVGMERSGTSLVEQILSSHPQVGGAGELPFWVRNGPMIHDAIMESLGIDSMRAGGGSPPSLDQIANEYLQVLAPNGEGKARITDKMPGNIAVLGLIHAVFPKAKIIWCLRSPMDNCLSIYFTAFRTGAPYLNNRSNIVHAYELHSELLNHWRSALPEGCLMIARYEELVSDKEILTRQMIDFLGLGWNDSCLRHEDNPRGVKTPSMWQARQPVYRTSVERWKNYEPWLGEFESLRKTSH